MHLELLIGAWIVTRYGWSGIWLSFALWIVLDIALAIYWPDFGRGLYLLGVMP